MNQVTPNFIEKLNHEDTPENFEGMVKHGIELLQKLTGTTWTDYNLHDPGVTILEQLCFAFTDLAFRTGFPIEDLLTSEKGEINKQDHSFFDKDKILTTNPVTINDFKKVILDEVEEVDNVQIIPLTSDYSAGYIKGLYRIFIEVGEATAKRLQSEPFLENEIISRVRRVFVSHRNLGEDTVRLITLLKPYPIKIKANILVKEFILPEDILIDIYSKLQNLLSPKVQFYSESELSKKDKRVEEIYEGPLLKRGLIPDSELKPMITEVDLLEVIKSISSAHGVLLVQKISVNEQEKEGFGKPFQLPENTFPYLELENFTDDIHLYTGEYKLICTQKDFINKVDKFERVNKYQREHLIHTPASGVLKIGKWRNPGSYHSIQKNFPIVYGLGEMGVSSFESDRRKAQVKQLKAYLVFFEQILANYLAQLSSLGNLYSTKLHEDDKSFYFDTLYNVPGIKDIFLPGSTPYQWEEFTKDPNNAYIKCLREKQETVSIYRLRKHLMFEHLLGRFNKKFSTYPVLLYIDLYGEKESSKAGLLLEWKADILRTFPETEYNRIQGDNYLNGSKERSGFEKKIYKLLYIRNEGKKKLSAIFDSGSIACITDKGRPSQTKEQIKRTELEGEEMNIVSGSEDVLRGEKIEKLFEGGISQKDAYLFTGQNFSVLKHGISLENYRVIPSPDIAGQFVIVYKEPTHENWKPISRHPDEESAQVAVKKLTQYLKELSLSSEGFHIVEHLLLRPLLNSDSFGFKFYRKKDDLLVENFDWCSFLTREKVIDDLVNTLTKPYQHSKHEVSEKFRFKIHGAASPLILSASEKDQHLDQLHSLDSELQCFNTNQSQFYPRFKMAVKRADGKIIDEEFFNLRVTVVLPTWPARFQEPEFRSYVENLFRLAAPAYLHFDFMWLGLTKMKAFEQLYFEWIDSLKENYTVNPLSEKLALMIGGDKFLL